MKNIIFVTFCRGAKTTSKDLRVGSLVLYTIFMS